MYTQHKRIRERWFDYYKNVDYADKPHHSQWSDDIEFTQDKLDEFHEYFLKHSICFKWKECDVLILGNLC